MGHSLSPEFYQMFPMNQKSQTHGESVACTTSFTNLLTPHKETELHGANFIKPPHDIIDGEEEYEVEEVLEAKT